MEFPQTVRMKIDELTQLMPVSGLKNTAARLSEKYRNDKGGKRVLTDAEAAVYAAVRMPATFAAVGSALGYALECTDDIFESLMDLGAGTGAAALAADMLVSPGRVVCLEREAAMRNVGSELLEAYGGSPAKAEWRRFDITAEDVEGTADMVVSSYMLNEISPESVENAVDKMWAAARKMLLIVEPGTPAGYKLIRRIRTKLLSLGAYIAAPCPHTGDCPASETDWCHFSCRVARNRLHKLLKDGDAPYEDEKFTYIAASRSPCGPADVRIMRHPYIEKGRISLRLCTENGFEDRLVTSRDKSGFKRARKAGWGGKL